MTFPLYDAERDGNSWTPPLDLAIGCARGALARHQSSDIHDDRAMLMAAVGLENALRHLVAALDNEAW
ncbi:hypothetical protein ACFWIB_10360 [Streptomyces sp. NPDC127051]|uniref:hypothetical protein n=1 Tax=Streptomyces sp. NPDC127051 TaxID=3347119 RepID=UPI003654CF6E